MGVHSASHHLVRRPLQNVPLWGRLLTSGGLGIRMPPSGAALRPPAMWGSLSSCARPGGYPGKRRSARVTRPPGPEGQPAPQHVVYASLAALALLRCSAQRFFCAAEIRLRAAALRTRLPPAGFGAADAAEGMALPFSVA